MLIDIGDLKTAREIFRTAQTALARSGRTNSLTVGQSERLSVMIEQIDILRPVDADGKHRDNHTLYCGCDDAAQDDVWEIFSENMLTRSIELHNNRTESLGRRLW